MFDAETPKGNLANILEPACGLKIEKRQRERFWRRAWQGPQEMSFVVYEWQSVELG